MQMQNRSAFTHSTVKRTFATFVVLTLVAHALPCAADLVLNPTTNVIAGDFSEAGATPMFQPIADIIISEGVSSDIAVQANRVLILNAPNWRFKPGTGSVKVANRAD